jgi:hypothetical protein
VGISENSGVTTYNALQVSVERRFASGLQFGAAYTYSCAEDNSSDLTDTLPDAYNDRLYYGISDLDFRARADSELHLRTAVLERQHHDVARRNLR